MEWEKSSKKEYAIWDVLSTAYVVTCKKQRGDELEMTADNKL